MSAIGESVAVLEQEENRVQEVAEVIDATVAVATAMQVRIREEADQAAALLTKIAADRKRSEEARTFLVRPLNEHVKRINARFKTNAAPLEEADRILRGKLQTYLAEQERLRQIEQARLDAERVERERLARIEQQRVEAEARAAAEKAAAETARLAREAAAAEAERQRQLAEEADDTRRQVAKMDTATLQAATRAADGTLRGYALEEVASRMAAFDAQMKAQEARQAELDAATAAAATAAQPPVELPRMEVAATAPLTSGKGGVGTSKQWKGRVHDLNLVPREYLRVEANQKAIDDAVRAGARDIPGITIEQIDRLAVRAS